MSVGTVCDQCGQAVEDGFRLPFKFGDPKVLLFELFTTAKRGTEPVSLDLCRFCLTSLLTEIATWTAPAGISIRWENRNLIDMPVKVPKKENDTAPKPVEKKSE